MGLLSVNLVSNISSQDQKNIKLVDISVEKENGIGTSGACYGKNNLDDLVFGKRSAASDPDKVDLKILSKPRAQYTEVARQNQVTGTVRVRVTFLPSGEIGSVIPIKSLPDGLTEEAICAANRIRFKPATRNGKPVSVIKIIEYQFNIY